MYNEAETSAHRSTESPRLGAPTGLTRVAGNSDLGVFFFAWATLGAAVTYGVPLVFGDLHDDLTISITAGALVTALSIVFFLSDRRLFLLYWISLVMLQNVAAGFWHTGHADSVPLMVTEAKSLALVVGIILSAPDITSLLRHRPRVCIGLGLYIFAVLWNANSLDPAAMANLRNFLAPFALIFLGWSLSERIQIEARKQLLVAVLGLATFWMALGTVGELLMGTAEWRAMFSAESLGSLNSLSETTSFFGVTLTRVGGVLMEPSNTGYLAASVIIVLLVRIYFSAGREIHLGHFSLLSAATLALVYASVKNANLMFTIAVLGVLFMVYWGLRPWLSLLLSWVSAFIITMAYIVLNRGTGYLLTVWSDPLGSVGGDSSSVHMAGLISGFTQLADEPLGHGLGSGGNMRAIMEPELTWTEWLTTGSESSWGTLAYQLGAFGVVGFVLTLFAVANIMGRPSTVLLAVWSAAALFVEAFFGPISGSLLLLAAGLMTAGSHHEQSPESLDYGQPRVRSRSEASSPGAGPPDQSAQDARRLATGWI